ncbi:MAG: electron transfer flavoprotein subunit alpha/FixB family protein [Acetobacteraceae bacterium]
MANVLVHIETRAGNVQPISLELLTAARGLAAASGGTVEAALLGAPPSALGALGAADRVLTLTHPALACYTPEAHALALLALVRRQKPAVVLLGYTTIGLDLAPALALCANLPLVSYCRSCAIAGEEVETTSLLYGGKLVARARSPLPAVLAITPGSFSEAPASPAPATALEVVEPPAFDALRTAFLRESAPDANAIDIAKADKIVCVGRGIGGRNSIALAEEVASLLGAEVAGSRPVIDSGWLPKERQVGKSGRKVAPKLYLAVGVSGAPEHLEGMRGAELIVAINTDAKAPIFEVAHVGATCDLFEFLPALEERLKTGAT